MGLIIWEQLTKIGDVDCSVLRLILCKLHKKIILTRHSLLYEFCKPIGWNPTWPALHACAAPPCIKTHTIPQRNNHRLVCPFLCSRPVTFSESWGQITRKMMFNLTGCGCELNFGIPGLMLVLSVQWLNPHHCWILLFVMLMRFWRPPDHSKLNEFIILFVYCRCLHSAVWTCLRLWCWCYILMCWCARIDASPVEQCSIWRSMGVSAPQPPCLVNSFAQSLRATRFSATLRYSLMAVTTIEYPKFHWERMSCRIEWSGESRPDHRWVMSDCRAKEV